MMKAMSYANLPKNCWIHEKKRYTPHGPKLAELPYVVLKYEPILKANGIPYRKSTRKDNSTSSSKYEIVEVFEYWNPTVGLKEEELSFPLFAKVLDGYRYCGRNHTGKACISETLEAAQETKKFVDEEIKKYKEILRDLEAYRYAKEQLAGAVSIMCLARGKLPDVKIHDIEMNHDNFKVLRVLGFSGYSEWVAIFDMNKLAKARGCEIYLKVPKHIAGLVIGKRASNIKDWAKQLGVKKIHVVPV